MIPRTTMALALGLVLSVFPTAAAQADWLFTPYLGGTFAGSTALPNFQQDSDSQIIFGGSAGWWTPGVFGVEADIGYVPRFFRHEFDGLITDSTVLTLDVDVVVAAPVSVTRESLRPYLIGGLGWMHASRTERTGLFPEIFERAQNSVGMNIGGGAIGFITRRTGLRFELRHFRSLERDANLFMTADRQPLLSFWRATVGVVIRR